MSITITGGFTMAGGGFTLVAAPPATPTAGWMMGGRNISLVNRVTFATDTNTASVRGPLSKSTVFATSTGTNTYGWVAGGKFTSGEIDRITYATDTATATVRSTMYSGLTYYGLASVTDNSSYGWFAGGWNPLESAIQRLTYASDTDTPVLRGPLSSAKGYARGVCNSSYGWIAGGQIGGGSSTTISNVERITYATDTDTTSTRGPMNRSSTSQSMATGTETYGWIAGGAASGPFATTSAVSRINYANDTVTASARGPLSSARYGGAASTDSTSYGWFGGGTIYPAPTPGFVSVTTVDRIDFANDTGTASIRGPLTAAYYGKNGTSGVQ